MRSRYVDVHVLGAGSHLCDNTAAQAALRRKTCRNRIGNSWMKGLCQGVWGTPLRFKSARISAAIPPFCYEFCVCGTEENVLAGFVRREAAYILH